ncbi:tetratricopeptide repeat protein [Mangrovibacterium sp.]|uniref:tetratricopeptide repeat protein n=1 Tax=Mangrovibacterium sp. TaxID=1961364 RepID=UPI00356A1264
MNITELLSGEKVERLKSIEEKLLSRRKNGKVAGIAAMLTAVGQVLVLFWPVLKEMLSDEKTVDLTPYFINPVNYALLLLVVIFLLIYFLLRRTSVLLKATEEPFRYTFYVEPFQFLEQVNDAFQLKNVERLKMLNYDLTELINKRIKRFSILKEESSDEEKSMQATDPRKTSHIRIYGNYSVREDKENGDWIIHIMPYVQVGNSARPATLAQSVRFSLTTDETPDILDTREYNQLMERVYSRVTTEIYSRIKQDIDGKVKLFPTSFLQENALYQEARDMAASNTINAFDSAIDLYERAMHQSETSIRVKFARWLLLIPLLRFSIIRFLHHYSRIRIGHSLCLIYKKRIASLSGRNANPIFEIRHNLKMVISRLEQAIFLIGRNPGNRPYQEDLKTFMNLAFLSFPTDSLMRKILLRPSRSLFDDTREILFNAYVVHALSDTLLNAFKLAREQLECAKALAPDLCRNSVLYILAEGYLEPDIDKAILLFQKACEKDPSFQIARYDLAFWSEMKFRKDGLTDRDQAYLVLGEYDNVLKVNPGNIAALAAQGYIYWILKELNKARRKFEEGIEIKAIVSETFVGILWCGLARVYAEKGYITKSFNYYNQAIVSSPNVGAYFMYDNSNLNTSFYEFISPGLLNRFEDYQHNFFHFRSFGVNNVAQLPDEQGLLRKALQERNTAFVSDMLHRHGLTSGSLEIIPGESSEHWTIKSKSDELMPSARMQFYMLELSEKSIIVRQEASDNLLHAVSSYILNDLGNARLNFFRRFGDQSQLNQSVAHFEEAIKFNAKNLVAKYNKSLALLYQKPLLKQIDEAEIEWDNIRELIDISAEVIQNYPNWMEGLSSYFEIMKRTRQDLIVRKADLEAKIKQHEKVEQVFKLNVLQSGAPSQQVFDSGTGELSSVNKTTNRTAPVSKVAVLEPSESQTVDVPEMTKQVDQIRTILGIIDENIRKLVWKSIESTSYDPLYQGLQLGDFDSQAILQLMDKEIEWVKLNEMDARSLKLYATAFQYFKASDLSANYEAVSRLFDHLLNYFFPEDFDISLLRKSLLDEISGTDRYRNEGYEVIRTKGRLSLAIMESLRNEEVPPKLKAFFIGLGLPLEKDYDCQLEDQSNEHVRFAITCKDRHDLKRRHFLVRKKGKRIQIAQSRADYYDEILKSFTLFSLAQDAVNFEYLNYYAANYLSEAAYKNCLVNALYRNFNPMILALYSQSRVDCDELIRVISEFEKNLNVDESPVTMANVYNRAGNLLYEKGRVREAIKYYQKATALDETKPIYRANLGLMYAQLDPADYKNADHNYQLAVALRKKAVSDDYDLEFYLEGWAEVLYKIDKLELFESEASKLTRAGADMARLAGVYNRIGNLYFGDRRLNEAIGFYEQAILFDPIRPIFHANRALMALELESPDYELALAEYQKALKLRKELDKDEFSLSYYYEYLADTSFKAGKMQEFITQWEGEDPSILKAEDKANVYNRLGNLYYNGEQYQQAKNCYAEAIRLVPQRPIYQANMGLVLKNQPSPDVQQALQFYKEAVRLRRVAASDEYSLSYYLEYYADCARSAGCLSDFMAVFDRKELEREKPEDAASLYNLLGNLLFQDSRVSDAIPYYQLAIKLQENRPIFYANLGLMFTKQISPDLQTAYSFYVKAVSVRKNVREDAYDLSYYLNYLADSAVRVERLAEFSTYMDQSGDLIDKPEELAYLYNIIGNALYELGNPGEAKSWYSKAIELNAQRPVFYSNLALMYRELSPPDYQQALKYYEQAYRIRETLEQDDYDLTFFQSQIDQVKALI